jgi:nucleoside-diphosphate-sugar epimerase
MDNHINQYRNKTVAITGASGYLASVLIDVLQGASVHILRVSRRDLPPIAGVETLKADVCARKCWNEIVSKADVIFHLAGNTSVYAATKNPADSLNSTVLPITHLVAAAQATGYERRVVFASTATVYGLTDDLPVAEDAEPKPITNYDLHKLFAEKQLELATKKGIVKGVSLRLANVYGPSSSTSSADDRGIFNKITMMALQGNSLQLYGDGAYLRDYIYIDDVVRAFMVAGVEKGVVGRSFNVATGKSITVREIFNLVAERAEIVTGKRVNIENIPWPDGADPIEFRNFVADISSIRDFAGWHPIISLNQGIDCMIEHLLNKIKFN